MTYTISYMNGDSSDSCETYVEAKDAILARWPDAEIGHDGDLEGFGDETKFWANEESAIDDDGARALGCITGPRVRTHEVVDSRIERLGVEAGEHGDTAQYELCQAALAGDERARELCVRVILDAQAQG